MIKQTGLLVWLCLLPMVSGATVVFADESNENANFSGKAVVLPDAKTVNIIIQTDAKPNKPSTVVVSPAPVYYPTSEKNVSPTVEPRHQRLDELNKRSSYYRDKK